jgi:hypothetical protein
MRRLITFVAGVAILQKPDRLSVCAVIDGSNLADVTDPPDFEDFTDSRLPPWAT